MQSADMTDKENAQGGRAPLSEINQIFNEGKDSSACNTIEELKERNSQLKSMLINAKEDV